MKFRNRFEYRRPHRPPQQQGFTIVELLVATLIFSVVLLLVTVAILQISRVYYQGVTEANTQNTARNVIDTISQAIQFDGGPVDPGNTASVAVGSEGYFCVGSEEFIYYPGWQLIDGSSATPPQTIHGLVEQPYSGGCAPAAPNGRELLSPKMRLSNLTLDNVGTNPNAYQIEVRVTYGDSDLLQSISNPSDPNGATATDANCAGNKIGTQFCAVSDLTTTVVKRVQ